MYIVNFWCLCLLFSFSFRFSRVLVNFGSFKRLGSHCKQNPDIIIIIIYYQLDFNKYHPNC